MQNNLENWLSQNDIDVDSFGRVIIDNEEVISEINGAMNALPFEVGGDCGCGGGCDHCG